MEESALPLESLYAASPEVSSILFGDTMVLIISSFWGIDKEYDLTRFNHHSGKVYM